MKKLLEKWEPILKNFDEDNSAYMVVKEIVDDLKLEINSTDLYERYVIFEKESNMFLGINTDQYRVALRKHAARFTKKEALEYINGGYFIEKDKSYVIQDAQ